MKARCHCGHDADAHFRVSHGFSIVAGACVHCFWRGSPCGPLKPTSEADPEPAPHARKVIVSECGCFVEGGAVTATWELVHCHQHAAGPEALEKAKAEEREACAKWLEGYAGRAYLPTEPWKEIRKALFVAATAIRAGGEAKPTEQHPECSICRRRHGREVEHACE